MRTGNARSAHHRGSADPDDRHRCRYPLRRPGTGALGHARRYTWQAIAVHAGFSRRQWFGRGGHARIRASRALRRVPRARAFVLKMETIGTASELRAQISAWRRDGARIAFVPTMGSLHAGHYSLITQARAHAERVVASIFVNPTQFGPSEDFGRYPRTPEEDRAGLVEHGCDLLFAPKLEEIYPYGASATARVEVPIVSEPL